MYVVIPSSSNPLALASNDSILLHIPSVPKQPTTVVIPELIICDNCISGVLVLNPPSPPPPIK